MAPIRPFPTPLYGFLAQVAGKHIGCDKNRLSFRMEAYYFGNARVWGSRTAGDGVVPSFHTSSANAGEEESGLQCLLC